MYACTNVYMHVCMYGCMYVCMYEGERKRCFMCLSLILLSVYYASDASVQNETTTPNLPSLHHRP